MPQMIFVNLPVQDLDKSMAFFKALGFSFNAQFTDETAACMVLSDTIYVMILTHAKWATFTERPIPDRGSSEVALCLTCESRDEVNALTEAAAAAGGIADINPVQEHGFMMSRSLLDPDGHVWELTWMDPAMVAGEEPAQASA